MTYPKNTKPFLFIFIISLITLASAAQEKFPPLRPLKTDLAPAIDGVLDDPV